MTSIPKLKKKRKEEEIETKQQLYELLPGNVMDGVSELEERKILAQIFTFTLYKIGPYRKIKPTFCMD